jgi:hypothetical protein
VRHSWHHTARIRQALAEQPATAAA